MGNERLIIYGLIIYGGICHRKCMESADSAVQRHLQFVIEMTGGTQTFLAVLLRITFDREHDMSQSWDPSQLR